MLTFIASVLFYVLIVWYIRRREQLRLQEVRIEQQRQQRQRQRQFYN